MSIAHIAARLRFSLDAGAVVVTLRTLGPMKKKPKPKQAKAKPSTKTNAQNAARHSGIQMDEMASST